MDNRGRGRGRGDSRGRGDRDYSRGRGSGRISPSASSTSSTFTPRGRGGSPGGGGRGGRGGPPQVFSPRNAPINIDSRLTSTTDQNALVNSLRSLSLSSTSAISRITRPGFGKAGSAIALRANFFPIKYPQSLVLYEYTVSITPAVNTTERRTRKRILQLLEKSPVWAPFADSTAHDGAQKVIMKKRLPQEPFVVNLTFYEEDEAGPRQGAKVYAVALDNPVTLKTSDLDLYLKGDPNMVDYDAQPIISAFNLIISKHASATGVVFGRNRYFYPPHSFASGESYPLSTGVEAWKGFYSSVRPSFKQLMVNVNVCMSAFFVPNSSLADALLAYDTRSKGAAPQALLFYGKVRVSTSHLGSKRRNKIKGFGVRTARDTVFNCEELGGRVSVEQYFQRKYNIRLRHATDMPVVNIGSSTKDVFVPAEVCQIEPGQPYLGRLSEMETANMITFACKPPYENAQMITDEGLPKLGFPTRQPPMAQLGVEVSPHMAIVPARVLNPPRVVYKSGQPRVSDGSWNILGVKFHRPAALTDLAVLVIPDGGRDDFRGPQDLQPIVEGFLKKCSETGMQVTPGIPPLKIVSVTGGLARASPADPWRLQAIEQIEATIRQFARRPRVILVFMSNREVNIYPGLKRLCETKLGIHTVCMLNGKVRRERGQDQYYSNVALKVNAKLGGVNHTLDPGSLKWLDGAMLVGMDVTHAGPNTVRGTPSIAAMVASCDKEFMLYPASLRLQDRWKEGDKLREMVSDVKGMLIERLTLYRSKMKSLPTRIIVFRDGVSEGQFDQVILEELPGIKEAIRSFASYKPKLTIAICGKRHHARFYPMKVEEADRTSNTKAGTVVDQGVTGVYDFDYYLQAHAGLQGTVRSTHYTVIHDENKFAADELQQGTNSVSYLWARATKSVSLVPPAYWADRACERARCYLHEILPPMTDRDRKMNPEQIRLRAEQLWGNGVHENLKDSMFYL